MLDFLSRFFSYLCHQIPGRSFSLLWYGDKSILCSRCTGMYIGMIFGFIFSFCAKTINNNKIIIMILFSVIIVALEMTFERIFLFQLGNFARFMTGIIFGFSVATGIIFPIKSILGGSK